MGTWELVTISIGVAMDAFAVSICKGLSVQKYRKGYSVITGGYFGGFQAFMPLVGYIVGSCFQSVIEQIDHWVAFILLSVIGINMIRESRTEAEQLDADFSVKAMLPMAIATSIDALVVGITFAFFEVNIIFAVSFIGIITFMLSAVGVKIGNTFGMRYKSKAELAGGLVLIVMGIKTLFEHLGILG